MDEFLILLQAKLDEAKSKGNVNADIDKLQSQLDKLKIQVELDPKATQKLADSIGKLINQKIVISNIGIDTNASIRAAQKTGQQLGNAITQGIANTVRKSNDTLKSFTALKSFSELNKSINNFHVDTSELKNYQSILNDVKNTYAEFGQVRITNEIFKDGVLEKFKVNIEQVNGDLKETKSFVMALNDEKDAFVFSGLISGAENIVQHLDKTKNAVNQTAEAINALKEKSQIDTIISSLDDGSYDKQFSSLTATYKRLGLTSDEIRSKTNEVSTALEKLNRKNFDTIISDAENFTDVLKKSQNEAAILKTDLNNIYNPKKQFKLSTDIQNWLSKNSRASKEAKDSLTAYYRELSDGRVSVERLNYIETELKKIDAVQRGLGKLGKNLKDQFAEAGKSFTQWLSVSSGVMLLISKTKDAISEIKELDNILTEISKTSDMTSQQLKQLGMDAYDAASKYGRTASDYLLGVQEMARSGFYGEKGTAMAEQSLLAQSAGDMSADLANNYILATNAAYKFNGEADKLNAVLDGQNSITNRNSVAMADMATAMSEAGTVASSYRVSVEDLSAMIGTIEAVTKLGGSEVGNAIKAILINLQNVTSSKIVDTLDAANASMTEFVNGTEKLRNPIDILRDLAKTFNQLDEDDPLRAEILTNIGQKYHAAKLGALLQNMEMFDKMLVDYSEGTGSALEESNKSAENLTGTLNKLHNSWTEFVNGIIESEGLKTGVKLLNGLVEGATSLTSKLGSLGTIGLGGLGIGFTKFVENFD